MKRYMDVIVTVVLPRMHSCILQYQNKTTKDVVCVCVCVWCLRMPEKVMGPLELQLQAIVWVLQCGCI